AAGDGGPLGGDLGIANLATDREGEHFTGKIVHLVRARYHLRRQRVQQGGTKNAKRRVRQLRRRESRFPSDSNHVISQQLVQKAAVLRTALARDDRSGIRERTTVQRKQRSARPCWAFFQLRQYTTYQAAWAGVPVHLVDPRTTRRTCSHCGPCEAANRKSQES